LQAAEEELIAAYIVCAARWLALQLQQAPPPGINPAGRRVNCTGQGNLRISAFSSSICGSKAAIRNNSSEDKKGDGNRARFERLAIADFFFATPMTGRRNGKCELLTPEFRN